MNSQSHRLRRSPQLQKALFLLLVVSVCLGGCYRSVQIDGPAFGLTAVFTTHPKFKISDMRISASYRTVFARGFGFAGFGGGIGFEPVNLKFDFFATGIVGIGPIGGEIQPRVGYNFKKKALLVRGMFSFFVHSFIFDNAARACSQDDPNKVCEPYFPNFDIRFGIGIDPSFLDPKDLNIHLPYADFSPSRQWLSTR